MIRNLKTLGVALAAIFALGAVVASAASAQQSYLTADGPLKALTGFDIGPSSANRFTALGTFTHCSATYTGSVEGAETAHGTTFKFVPTYSSCKSTALNITTDVAMNGCYYEFHLQETAGFSDIYKVLSTLVCVGFNKPVITITGPIGNCVITITPQAFGYSGVALRDTTTGELELEGTATGMSVDASGGSCPQTGENLAASLDIDASVRGSNGGTTEIGISELGETTSHI